LILKEWFEAMDIFHQRHRLGCNLANATFKRTIVVLNELVAAIAFSMPFSGHVLNATQADADPESQSPHKNDETQAESTQAHRRLSEIEKSRIDVYQQIEDARAKLENRVAINILQEVVEGSFFLPRPYSRAEPELPIDLRQPYIEDELREIVGSRQKGKRLLKQDASVASLLREQWGLPATIQEASQLTRGRKLSPIESQVLVRLWQQLHKSKGAQSPFSSADQVERAIGNFQSWTAPIPFRPSAELLAMYRNIFASHLRALQVPESDHGTYLAQFDESYDSLPYKPCPACLDTKSRALIQYQTRENEEAGNLRKPRNILADYDKGEFFAPDVDLRAIIAIPEFVDIVRRGVRPTPEEQASELKELRSLLVELDVSSDLVQEICELRESAWQQIPESLPERITRLIWRTPGAEELEAILDYYRAHLKYTGADDTIMGARLKSCRDYYASKHPPNERVDAETLRDIRDNYETLMREGSRLPEDQIKARLERFDTLYR
jgi:hypothetical protein